MEQLQQAGGGQGEDLVLGDVLVRVRVRLRLRVKGKGCYLPDVQRSEVPRSRLGVSHRALVGLGLGLGVG